MLLVRTKVPASRLRSFTRLLSTSGPSYSPEDGNSQNQNQFQSPFHSSTSPFANLQPNQYQSQPHQAAQQSSQSSYQTQSPRNRNRQPKSNQSSDQTPHLQNIRAVFEGGHGQGKGLEEYIGEKYPLSRNRNAAFSRYKRDPNRRVPFLLTLADLSVDQLNGAIIESLAIKHVVSNYHPRCIPRSLESATIALVFSKRSTRTRVASETAATLLGANPMFLGAADSQLGVNETLHDTAKVVGSMADGFMARVNGHEDVEALVKDSPVPVINALSDLYHPTQILADLMTMVEMYGGVDFSEYERANSLHALKKQMLKAPNRPLDCLKGKKAAWVGDTNNISNELLVTLPRLGMEFAIASPEGYNKVDPRVWQRVVEAGTESMVTLTTKPEEALKNADIAITDTWISMGQEEEKASRLKAFEGYQITNKMVEDAGAKSDWKFMHCLPRKQEEVDDEVFYGPRSVVFPEAENRKWTTAACFNEIYGRWGVWLAPAKALRTERARRARAQDATTTAAAAAAANGSGSGAGESASDPSLPVEEQGEAAKEDVIDQAGQSLPPQPS